MPVMIVMGCAFAALLIVRFSLGRLHVADTLDIGHSTMIGRRQINADGFEWSRDGEDVMLVLADGIGSGTKGRTAALAALDSVVRTFEVMGATENPDYFFRKAFRNANDAVLRHIPDGTAGANMLCAVIRQGKLYYALAGNCQIYVLRNRQFVQLSEGQTLDVLAKNKFKHAKLSREEAKSVYRQKRVHNFVGKEDFKDLEMFDVPVQLQVEDCVAMLTDGVFDVIPTMEMERMLNTQENSETQCQYVMDWLEGLKDSEQDNASVVLARVNRI